MDGDRDRPQPETEGEIAEKLCAEQAHGESLPQQKECARASP
jgi:hypothetical protein